MATWEPLFYDFSFFFFFLVRTDGHIGDATVEDGLKGFAVLVTTQPLEGKYLPS